MFPPVRTESLNESLKGLWESLQGCYDYLSGNGSIEEPGPGKITVRMQLLSIPGAAAKQTIAEYTRLYLRECGWNVRGVTIDGGTLRLKLSPRR